MIPLKIVACSRVFCNVYPRVFPINHHMSPYITTTRSGGLPMSPRFFVHGVTAASPGNPLCGVFTRSCNAKRQLGDELRPSRRF